MYHIFIFIVILLLLLGELKFDMTTISWSFIVISFVYLGEISERFYQKKKKDIIKEKFTGFVDFEINLDNDIERREIEDEYSSDIRLIKGKNNKIPIAFNSNIANPPNTNPNTPYNNDDLNTYSRVDRDYLFNPITIDKKSKPIKYDFETDPLIINPTDIIHENLHKNSDDDNDDDDDDNKKKNSISHVNFIETISTNLSNKRDTG